MRIQYKNKLFEMRYVEVENTIIYATDFSNNEFKFRRICDEMMAPEDIRSQLLESNYVDLTSSYDMITLSPPMDRFNYSNKCR